jgi:hypothetical protein
MGKRAMDVLMLIALYLTGVLSGVLVMMKFTC